MKGQAHLRVATTGQAGLDLATHLHPDAILLDIHLPDMDNDAVYGRLRADPATAGIPIIVISADASSGVVRYFVDRGVTAYLIKPIKIQERENLLAKIGVLRQLGASRAFDEAVRYVERTFVVRHCTINLSCHVRRLRATPVTPSRCAL